MNDVYLLRLLAACAAAALLTWLAIGGSTFVWPDQLVALAMFCGVAAALALMLHLIASLARLPRHVQGGQVDMAALWREHRPLADALLCAGLMAAVQVANVGVVHIAELYRGQARVWHDAALWALEQPLFEALLPLAPGPWESVYHSMWLYVIGVMCALVVCRRRAEAARMALAAAAMSYVTQLVAIAWPTRGLAAYQPEAFAFLRGSLSWQLQQVLMAYQSGRMAQNGLMYGMVAMPSMHMALSALAGLHLVKLHRAGWVAAVAALTLIWISTLVLGWHYACDGVADIAMAVACHGALASWRRREASALRAAAARLGATDRTA